MPGALARESPREFQGTSDGATSVLRALIFKRDVARFQPIEARA